ncbi:ethylene-responsive transcription factor ERF015-like [Actinidia eriantha]|uniref:ethylene-responsive transcription factor ERF015-like n=1 Tax=Actinidia eriantha TaxID=165200 RepID=UPI00258A71C9|nr:ethylene-responsive transcription factor ERF015-like [Actinidia eriantha]
MDLGPTSSLQKGSRRRGKGPYVGVRSRGGRWVSEIRIPKTKTRIWLGSHHSPEKAARAYDAALYCLKGEQGSFNFPNNRRPDLANRSVGSLPVDEIQYPQNVNEMEANKVDDEPYFPAFMQEEEPYVPTFVPEEPYVPAYVPEASPMLHGDLLLDEWLTLDGDWMRNFH